MPYKDPVLKKRKDKEYSKKYYENNKEKVKAGAVESKAVSITRNKAFIKRFLGWKACKDCGTKDIRVLEFDHVRGEKRLAISEMTSHGYGIKSIKEEIRKCEVRCGNCHRIVTQERRDAKKAS